MITSKVLGKRLKFFRERTGKCQFDLESEAGLSSGALSRIESGKVNPTKETILALAEIIELNRWEIDYLVGRTSHPATEEEKQQAIKEVKDLLQNDHFIGYLGDDRWQFIAIGKGFPKILGATEKDADAIIGKTIIGVLVDDSLDITKFFSEEEYRELLETQLTYYFVEASFMFDDDIFKQTLKIINSNPITKRIWRNLSYKTATGFLSNEKRVVNFQRGPIKLPMLYSREPLLKYPRFEMMEYTPVNRISKLVTRLLT